MNQLSLTNRRIVLVAVMSLVASLLAVSFNAPVAGAANESIFFATNSSSVAEDVGGGTYTVPVTLTYDTSFSGDVTATVSVSGSADDPGDYTISGTAVEFLASGSPASGATHDVVISLVDDSTFDPGETIILTLTSPSGATIGTHASHTVTITDASDTPSIAINDIAVDENDGTATFTVTRTGATTQTVTANWATSNGTATSPADYTADTGTISIGSGATTDTIVITLTNDQIAEGVETFDVDLSSPSNATISKATGTATITDDDTAGISVVESDGSTAATEGGTDDFTVVLTSQPTANVVITISSDNVQATAASTIGGLGTLTFTDADWFIAQSVTVTAVDDDIDDDGANGNISLSAASGDGNYGIGDFADVGITITDNDDAGVTITPTAVSVTENGSNATYEVELTSEPVDDVRITLSLTNGGEFSVNDSTLDFDDTNWDNPITVTVSADDDLVADGTTSGTIEHSASSPSDPNYTGSLSIDDVDVTIIDNETPAISLVGAPTANEDGTNGTYGVVLTTMPSGTVTVTLSITSGGGEFSIVTSTPLTFDSGDYNVVQTVEIAANPDDIIDGQQTGTINHSASGGGYGGVADDQAVTVTIEDDDEAGVTITETLGSTDVIEGGIADTYRVVLDAEPAANVTVTVSFDSDQIAVTPASLTFTPGTWDVFQEFSVTGVQDNIEEPDIHSVSITHAVTTTDPNFSPIAVDSVVVNITDSDELEVSIEGPSFGAPGVTATFEAITNSSSGEPTYEWRVLKDFVEVPGILGTEDTFEFTPTEGGNYIIWARVGDDLNQGNDRIAFFIDFTVMGDIEGSIFVDNILWLAEEGVTKGCTQDGTSFCPLANVTRGQMAAFLVRFLGLTDGGAGDLFIDDDTSIFRFDIDKLATAGITKGCNPAEGNTKFCPNSFVTRGQMAAFLVRALKLTDAGAGNLFIDDDTSIFENDIDKLATAGITKGCNPAEGNTKFCPNSFVTRGQMAAFLQRAADLRP
ncbi:MAG: Calx-beta domain-containing protein [Acidimicrobiia bacterium]|nr:Calx-beta domain-containing protein [Acidimicrobiia bacterium]